VGLLAVLLLGLGMIAPKGFAQAEPLVLDAEQREGLAAGEVIVQPLAPTDGAGVATRGIAVVQAPPTRVWPVVRDCGEFSQFMPRVKESAQLEREGGSSICRTVMGTPFPFPDLFVEVRSVEQTLPDGGFRRHWTLLRGDFERNQGAWTVLPWGDRSEQSLLVYESDAKAKTIVPDFIQRAAQRETLPGGMRAIRLRVEELQ
jgi:hypothetical protein